MVKSCPVCKWSGIQMASEIWTFKCLDFKWHLNTGPVFKQCFIHRCLWYHPYALWFEYQTGIQMVLPFEIRTWKSLVFRYIRYSGVQFQMVTVYIYFLLHHKNDFWSQQGPDNKQQIRQNPNLHIALNVSCFSLHKGYTMFIAVSSSGCPTCILENSWPTINTLTPTPSK